MTGPVIPAELWPEWADRHCWNQDGSGVFCGATVAAGGVWIRTLASSSIPMPADHDWCVPVMRPQPSVDIGQATVTASWKDGRLLHALDCSNMPDGVHRLYAAPQPAPGVDLEQFREAVCWMFNYARTDAEMSHARRLLALIDGQ